MREKLQALLDLQTIDLEIASLRRSAETWPKQIAELERDLANERSAADAEKNRLTDIEQQRKTLDQNITDERDKVKKWEARLSEQRSTREYAALAREIDIAKKALLTMQEELVELGKQQAAARDSVQAAEERYKVRSGQISGQVQELRQQVEKSKTELTSLEEKRSAEAKKVDANLLRRYESIRKKKLPGLVAVTNGTCQGCNMNVPPQLYNTLRTSMGTDVCPSCNRIIYAREVMDDPASS